MGSPDPNRKRQSRQKLAHPLSSTEILETIFTTQYADQKWIDILSMIRRVHSTWHTVVRSIYPEFATHSPRELIQGDGEAWRATFLRDQGNAQAMIRLQREDTKLDPSEPLVKKSIRTGSIPN